MPASIPRNRWWVAASLALLVLAGVGSRAPGMPGLVVLYAGDVLWGALFFALGAWLRPAASPHRLWLGSTAVTELIEFSQLYQAPWAQAVRSTRLGGLLLGHAFLWSDVCSVALGTTFALAAELLGPRARRLRR